MVFERAVQKGPISKNQFNRPSADDILSEIASEINVEIQDVKNLYADQREMNVLEEPPPFVDGKG